MKQLLKSIKNRYFAILDILFLVCAYISCIPLVYPQVVYDNFAGEMILSVLGTVFLYLLVFSLFGVYRVYWIYGGRREYVRLLLASVLCVAGGTLLCCILVAFYEMYVHYAVSANLISVILIAAMRCMVQIIYKTSNAPGRKKEKRVLIIGAGQLAVSVLRDIGEETELNYTIVGLIDDDKRKKNRVVYGAKVIGNRFDIERICLEKKWMKLYLPFIPFSRRRRALF